MSSLCVYVVFKKILYSNTSVYMHSLLFCTGFGAYSITFFPFPVINDYLRLS